jgi:hypothetical protein
MLRTVRQYLATSRSIRCASTAVNPGMTKITNLSAGDPHVKVRDMSVFDKEKIR